MAIARQQVKNVGNVDQKGKDKKEADLVSACCFNLYKCPWKLR